MKLQFLGSGDAFGSGGRFNTCFHLERREHGNVLIDCGASSMVAIRKWGVDPNAVSTVLVSHLHGDHFAGLPFFLLDAQLVSRRTAPLTLAGPPGLAERLAIVSEAMFAGSTKVEHRFALEVRELALHERAEFGGLAVTPYLMKHYSGAPSYALRHLPEISPRRTIVTHMSAELLGRRAEMAVEAAEDGMVVEF
jgi:ribonuclease BN (tRNA processing enzyme)